jgi:anti-anti-sigma regulatory factor
MRTIQLPARCDRAAAEALLPEMQAALGSGMLQIDASATEQIGQAMLQLLVSAKRTGEGANIIPSTALIEASRS